MSARFRRPAWPGAKLLGLFVFSAFPIALRITSALQFRNKRRGVGQVFVRIIAAVVLCLTPCSSLLAEDVILRCDAPQGGVSFSVSVDPTAHSVHSLGFANKVETNQFSDTVIVASSRESPQSRLMNRSNYRPIPIDLERRGCTRQGRKLPRKLRPCTSAFLGCMISKP